MCLAQPAGNSKQPKKSVVMGFDKTITDEYI
jgi:hypothetical protein